MSKDGVHTLYFYLDTELFGFNLNNYKELKEVPLTHFLQELNPLFKPTINGFVDVAGERVYDAIQTKQLSYSEKSNADFGQAIPVGGFKQLRFRLGAGKAENPTNQPYTVTIFGEDYYKAGSYREKNEAVTVLFEEKITNDTALKQHTVKLDGHRVIYLEIDNYNNKENQHLEPYPIILEGLNALK